MTGTPHSHIGITVADLEQAIERFSALLGLTFTEPRTIYFNQIEDPEPRQTQVRCSFSKEGPPHLELMEGTDSGLHALGAGEGFHHVGVWVPQAESHMKIIQEKGYSSDARVITSDGTILAWFSDPSQLNGIRVEFVDDADRDFIEHFMKTGEFEGEFRV